MRQAPGRSTHPIATIGAAIREARERRELTQEALAERCDLHLNYISLVERGEKNPTIGALLLIAAALETSPADFFQHVGVPDMREVSRFRSKRGRARATRRT